MRRAPQKPLRVTHRRPPHPLNHLCGRLGNAPSAVKFTTVSVWVGPGDDLSVPRYEEPGPTQTETSSKRHQR